MYGRGNYWRSQRRKNYRGRNDSYNKKWGNNSRSSARVNPIDGDGNIMTFDFCCSKYHFEKDCNDFKLHMSSNSYASSGSQTVVNTYDYMIRNVKIKLFSTACLTVKIKVWCSFQKQSNSMNFLKKLLVKLFLTPDAVTLLLVSAGLISM